MTKRQWISELCNYFVVRHLFAFQLYFLVIKGVSSHNAFQTIVSKECDRLKVLDKYRLEKEIFCCHPLQRSCILTFFLSLAQVTLC